MDSGRAHPDRQAQKSSCTSLRGGSCQRSVLLIGILAALMILSHRLKTRRQENSRFASHIFERPQELMIGPIFRFQKFVPMGVIRISPLWAGSEEL